MQNFKDEKADVEVYIEDLVKKVSDKNKLRIADILTGVALAERQAEEEPYPHEFPA